jgi:hypothetical protein
MIVSRGDSFGLIKVSLITTFLANSDHLRGRSAPTRDVFELLFIITSCASKPRTNYHVETPKLKIPFAIKKRNINEKLILQLIFHYNHNPTTHHI